MHAKRLARLPRLVACKLKPFDPLQADQTAWTYLNPLRPLKIICALVDALPYGKRCAAPLLGTEIARSFLSRCSVALLVGVAADVVDPRGLFTFAEREVD